MFWYFRTAFLRDFHHADGEELRSTETILHPTRAAKQGGFRLHVRSTLYAREASVAPATPLCAGHAQQLGGESPPPNLMEVKG